MLLTAEIWKTDSYETTNGIAEKELSQLAEPFAFQMLVNKDCIRHID